MSRIFLTLIISSMGLALVGCSDDQAQRTFEQQALVEPSGIMAQTVNATAPENGQTDADDWRTAPEFSGLTGVQVDAAFPNPVSFNQSFTLTITVGGANVLTGFELYAFQQPGQLVGPLRSRSGTLDAGTFTLRLSPREFAQQAGTFSNLYRLIMYDGRGAIISYGDVEVVN